MAKPADNNDLPGPINTDNLLDFANAGRILVGIEPAFKTMVGVAIAKKMGLFNFEPFEQLELEDEMEDEMESEDSKDSKDIDEGNGHLVPQLLGPVQPPMSHAKQTPIQPPVSHKKQTPIRTPKK